MDHQKHNFLKLSASPLSITQPLQASDAVQSAGDEALHDVDEPPDDALLFRRQPIKSPSFPGNLASGVTGYFDHKPRQHSLLTEGLLTISTPKAQRESVSTGPRSSRSTFSTSSLASAAELTSDGGLTSPARTSTPSPPLPSTTLRLLPVPDLEESQIVIDPSTTTKPAAQLNEGVVEPPRKRCITFACARPAPVASEAPAKPVEVEATPAPTQRRCALKFACPAKPVRNAEADGLKVTMKSPVHGGSDVKNTPTKPTQTSDGDATPKKSRSGRAASSPSPTATRKKTQPEALRFHEFASARLHEDEWTQQQPARQRKLTVDDTLKKEKAISKLGEEAEAEALEEEDEEEEAALDEDDNDDGDNDSGDLDEDEGDDADDLSDDGNETDDEEGFADSDDESETNPEYQFWTPGWTTAATSIDQIEHIRARQKRTASQSSIESIILANDGPRNGRAHVPAVKATRRREKVKAQPATPELPDSTDFVCGTLDEDRPLEEAYKSCLEQRKQSKRVVLPQDLDPSFPTSDPEQEDSDEDRKDVASESQAWIAGKPDESDIGRPRGRKDRSNRNSTRSPSISPKRRVSPAPKRRKSPAPPVKRVSYFRSPAPKGLFGHSPKRMPSPSRRNPDSPPCSRHPSFDDKNIPVPQLAQRPHLTHTKSLPRTPNPFWHQLKHAKAKPMCHIEGEIRRGPIAIVQGLENKRQRRKEKYMLTHARHAGKEKDRRCQPGKGAERMREVGLEMADRCKGYGHRLQVVLSA